MCEFLCVYMCVCVCPFVQLMSLSTVLQVQRDSRSYRGRGTYLLVKDTDATQLFHLCWNMRTHAHTHTNKLLKPFSPFFCVFFFFVLFFQLLPCHGSDDLSGDLLMQNPYSEKHLTNTRNFTTND